MRGRITLVRPKIKSRIKSADKLIEIKEKESHRISKEIKLQKGDTINNEQHKFLKNKKIINEWLTELNKKVKGGILAPEKYDVIETKVLTLRSNLGNIAYYLEKGLKGNKSKYYDGFQKEYTSGLVRLIKGLIDTKASSNHAREQLLKYTSEIKSTLVELNKLDTKE